MVPEDNFHCSIQDEYKVRYNTMECDNSSCVECVQATEPKAMGLGTVMGVLIALVIEVLLGIKYNKPSIPVKKTLSRLFNRKNFLRITLLSIVGLLSPVIVLLLILALLYKVICSVLIRLTDKHFVSFLDSFDVFWSLEDDTTKSVINALGVIESNSSQEIADNIKQKLQTIVPNDANRKIFYRRNERYGFYYWRQYTSIDIDQYVQLVEFEETSNNHNESDLESLMTVLQDQKLPYKDEGLFKILITRQRIGKHEEKKGEYGIIFRIHHSVGDGVALTEFLCQIFSDKPENYHLSMFSLPETSSHNTPSGMLDMIGKLIAIPFCFADSILRKPDVNALHGPSLSGKKIFKWTNSDEDLMAMIKDIKANVHQFYFSEVLLTSLSSSLRSFLAEKITPVPEDIAVILPIRFPKKATGNSIMKNNFSVAILDVPLQKKNRINEIKKRYISLRNGADPLANYIFLKIVCGIIPKCILQYLLRSRHATMVFSNMPGPNQLKICGGNALKSLIFFIPHNGTTGLGITALSYGGVLRLAGMVDEALISDPEDLTSILDGMVAEIRRMHRRYVTQ